MDQLIETIQKYSDYAPWIIFGSILLAGFNIPISLDAIVIISALLAATTLPEKTVILFFSVFFGAVFSAWISYWFGRTLGRKLLRFRLVAKWLHVDRLNKLKDFYEKYGLWTLLIGRFIPFGVRNCLFFTTGMSRMHFGKFILRDFIACFVWLCVSFYLFYTLGMNYHLLFAYVKRFNIIVFLAFIMTVIAIIWYKVKKRKGTSS